MSKSVFLRLFLAGLLVVGLVIACGGGGGDDDDDGDDIAILDEYQYNFNLPEDSVYASWTQDEGDYEVGVFPAFEGPTLSGSYNTETGEITITGGALDVDSDRGEDLLFGEFRVQVASTITIPEDGYPTSIGFLVYSSVGETTSRITVTYNPNVEDSGFDGVDLDFRPDLYGTPGVYESSSHTWEAFEALLENEKADEWEKKASFSFNIVGFLLEQMEYAVNAFNLIDENEDRLLSVNPVTESCDSFSGAGLTAPAGLEDPGTADFSWEEGTAGADDGEVGPGDSFSMDFDDCWNNDPEDDFDDLIQGGLDFTGYMENIETVADVETLTGIGFEEITFRNLVLSETYTEGDVCTLEGNPTTITGTFSIWFYALPEE